MRTHQNQQSMPLLVKFTPATPIEEETEVHNFIYDDKNQILHYDMMREIGTKSLKSSYTKKRNISGFWGLLLNYELDKKNVIDDSKFVR